MMNQSKKTGSWIDLPRDIIRLVLTDFNYFDRVRFRAVCKTWRESTDDIADSLPLVTHYPWTLSEAPPGTNLRWFTCELFDPFAAKSHQTSDSIPNLKSLSMQHDDLTLYASKHGWVLLGLPERRSFFFHNPFSNDTIPLPRLKSSRCVSAATFTDNPKSPKCEILVLCRCIAHRSLWLYRYCPSGDTSWSAKFLEFTKGRMFSMCYSKEYLYYLSEDATLRSYNLAGGTLMTHISKIVPPDFAFGYWMIENKEDLIMVCKYMLNNDSFQWSAYKLDSSMSWVPADWRSKKVAIFVSGKIAISRTLNVQNKGDCLVFSQEVDRDDMYRYRVACYSVTERKEVESNEYNWIDMSYCKKKIAFV